MTPEQPTHLLTGTNQAFLYHYMQHVLAGALASECIIGIGCAFNAKLERIG
jgi:hypothetical protein